MEIKEKFKTLGGIFTIKVWKDASKKELLKEVNVKNKMTNASLAAITGLVGNTGSQTAFTYLALGTSSTAVSAAHTALQAEITDSGLARAAATVSRATTTQTNDTLLLEKEWTATGSKTIEEVGIFNDASAGTMLARALTGSISAVSGNVIGGSYKWVCVGN